MYQVVRLKQPVRPLSSVFLRNVTHLTEGKASRGNQKEMKCTAPHTEIRGLL